MTFQAVPPQTQVEVVTTTPIPTGLDDADVYVRADAPDIWNT
ncbi:hypothetical protein [Actinophytocola sp.]|nr:hypothetical protein [Actinophytocola sp.]HYQ69072.1 hypothetical protein [Actinophytocola sp.]